MRVERWAVTGVAAAAMALLVAASIGLLGFSEQAIREIVRWTTRLGAPVFVLAFAARPLHVWLGSDATKWLLRNRRYVGLSFSVAHFTHLAAIGVLALVWTESFRDGLDPVTLYGGGAVYLLLVAMTITSFDRTAALLSRRNWKRLHVTGSYAIWFVFMQNYLGMTLVEGARFAPLALLLLAAFALRMWTRFVERSARAVAQPSGG